MLESSLVTETTNFGKRIQEIRLAKNLSQRELARKAKMDFTYLSKIESGRMPPPKEDIVARLAGVLGADLNELLVLAGKTPPVLQTSEGARRFFFRHAPNLKEEQWEQLLREMEKDPE